MVFSSVMSTPLSVARVGSVESPRGRRTIDVRIALTIICLSATIGCRGNAALEDLSQARQRSADLLVQFTKAADAANKAVMADTDDASVAFVREAEQAKQAIQTNVDALQPLLQGLNYSDESRLLQEFVTRFGEYGQLDRSILDLAVENTNIKAQRLSFGPAREAADSFRDAVAAIVAARPADEWRVKAVAASAVAAVREIQALQAPHIADADDAAMTTLETRMATAAATARSELKTLAPLVSAATQPKLRAAADALERFMGMNAQITALSRRNTNVKSIALSLNQKGKLTGACEDSLRALRDALASRGFTATR